MILKKRKIICTLVLIGILLIIIPTSFATDTSNLSIGNNHDISANTTITEYNNDGDVDTLNENTKFNSFKLNQNNNLNNPDPISTYASTNDAETFTDLNTAINSASGNEITLTKNYTYNSDDGAFKDGITIDRDLTINGAGYTINGSDTARIFHITGDNTVVTINNLTLTNGNTGNRGGAIYFESQQLLTINNSYFQNNNATEYGGAIYSKDGSVTVTSSNFTSNNVTQVDGGAIRANNVTVTGSNFTGNTANTEGGGAICANDANITGSNFTGNKADLGGAIYSYGNVTVTGSIFTSNTANSAGGAICANNVTVSGSIFISNAANTNDGGAIWAVNINITGSNFTGNNAKLGGAINADNNANVNNSNFTGNYATINGGAIRAYRDVNVTSSNFTGNYANINSGAIHTSVGDVTVISSNFTGNHANDNGGAIWAVNINITGSNFTDNNASKGGAIRADYDVNVTGSNFTGNKADLGGAIWAVNINITGSNFTDNKAGTEGGAITADNNVNVNNSSFTGNYATKNGGAIRTNKNNVEVNNSNFTSNTARDTGGAIWAGNDVKVTGSIFIGNNAIIYNGGAFQASGNANVSDSIFINNTANTYGGAISAYRNNVEVNNSNFTGNTVNLDGGAIYIEYGAVNVTNSNFTDNTANEYGGAILAYYDVNVTNSNFTSNEADSGGAIYATNVDVSGSIFHGNKANGGGGAILANNDVNVSGSNFTGNNATLGGAIYVFGTGGVDGSNFTGNSADNGSAIYISKITDTFNISNSNFTSNLVGTTSNISDNGTVVFGVLNKGNNVLDAIYNNDDASKLFINGTPQSIQSTLLSNHDVSIVINGVSKGNQRTDENGTFTFDAGYGSLTININCAESNLYKLNQTITISNFMETSITNDYLVTFKGSVSINVISPNDTVTSGDVEIYCNGTLIGSGTIINGVATFNINNLDSGNYLVTVSYLGSNNFSACSKDMNLEIIKEVLNFETSITNDYLMTQVNGSVSINVISPNGIVSGCVDLRKGGTLITSSELVGGTAILSIVGLDSGNYTVIVYYLGNDDYSGSSKFLNLEILPNKVQIPTLLTGIDFNESYNANKTFNISLTDTNGNKLVNQTIELQLINKAGEISNYSIITDEEGLGRLVIDLGAGEYTIIYSFNGTGVYTSSIGNNSIIVNRNKVNVTASLYNSTAGSNFTVKLLDEFANPIVGAEVKLTLFNQLGDSKVYWSTTNTEGIAKLPINLISANWTIETSYPNKDYDLEPVNQTVIVQPSNTTAILSPDKYNETYGTNKNFTLNFKTTDGISIVGKELPLTLFNELGDFKVYWRTTNTEGIAKLPINLIPGNWIIESAYTGEDYIVSSVNQTVTVTELSV